jgi:hypothetical protein
MEVLISIWATTTSILLQLFGSFLGRINTETKISPQSGSYSKSDLITLWEEGGTDLGRQWDTLEVAYANWDRNRTAEERPPPALREARTMRD